MNKIDGEVLKIINKTKEVYIPELANILSIEKDTVTQSICNVWEYLDNPFMYNNMLVISKKEPSVYYEFCDGQKNRGGVVHKDLINEHIESHQKEDQHISVYMHDENWVENLKKTNSVSIKHTKLGIEWIPLELDRESIEKSVEDAITIYTSFPYKDRIRMYFSGNRSIHVMIHSSIFGNIYGDESIAGIGKLVHNLAVRLADDCRYKNKYTSVDFDESNVVYKKYYETFGVLPKTGPAHLQEVRQKLQNIDPNLFNINSTIRQPLSTHHKTGKQKVNLNIKDLLFRNFEHSIENNVIDRKPYLIGWVDEEFETKRKRKSVKPFKNKSVIEAVFSDIFEDFDPDNAGATGWVGNLSSPFYDDGKPSVCVNVERGFYKDFGDPDQTYGLLELVAKYYEVDIEEANKILKEYEKIEQHE